MLMNLNLQPVKAGRSERTPAVTYDLLGPVMKEINITQFRIMIGVVWPVWEAGLAEKVIKTPQLRLRKCSGFF